MTEALLSPGHPQVVADLFSSHEVVWERGWGDRKTHTCLHGALLRPCAEPGDEIMWSILLSRRGLTMGWNDISTEEVVINRLRNQSDPDEAEMIEVFGSHWAAARTICRQYASATTDQLRDARDAWDARAAWDAWDAFLGVIGFPWIDETTGWNRAAYDLLVGPWESVFGPIVLVA